MHISVSVENTDQVSAADFPSDLPMLDFAAYMGAEFGMDPLDISFLLHGKLLAGETLAECGVADDDLLLLRRVSTSATSTSARDPVDAQIESLRQQALANSAIANQLRSTNPEIHAALDNPSRFSLLMKEYAASAMGHDNLTPQQQQELARLQQNPDDPANQARIMEIIQQEQIEENFNLAYDISPESFTQVNMLYIPITVNGHKAQAFVDTGAQLTIISPAFAEKVGISRLIDKRYRGIANGVGSQEITGRIHSVPITIGDSSIELPCTFLVLQILMDMLFGLDMLRRHQCKIDLLNDSMTVGGHIEVKFLHESKVQKAFGHSVKTGAEVAEPNSKPSDPVKTDTPLPATNNPPSQSLTSFPENDISRLMSLGFSRAEAVGALQQTNGNVEMAASLFFQ